MTDRMAGLLLALLLTGGIVVTPVYAEHEKASFGTRMPDITGHTISINGSTTMVRVEHLDTLRIRNSLGQSFSWRFDTFYVPTGFPLKRIAPPEFDAGDTWVYVYPRRVHLSD